MREYETTFVVQPEITDDVREAFLAKVDGVLEAQGAVRLMLDDWGKRKLAYEIENFQKGHYYSLKYLDEGAVVSELERSLRLEESVLRYLTVRVRDEVQDIDSRKAEAAEEERKLHERLEAERVAREEEERARREAEARAAEEAAAAGAAAAAAAAEAAEAAEAGADPDAEEAPEASGEDDASEEDAAEEAPEPGDDEPGADENGAEAEGKD